MSHGGGGDGLWLFIKIAAVIALLWLFIVFVMNLYLHTVGIEFFIFLWIIMFILAFIYMVTRE